MREILGEKLYTTQEVAELLGVSVETIRNYEKKEFLSSIRLSGKKYWNEDSVRKFLRRSVEGK